MNQLQTFNFSDRQVRVAILNGEPWWCAQDVCSILGYKNGPDAIKRHCKDGGIAKHDTPTQSGFQQMIYINEPNMYRLIAKSTLPEAEKFESWIFDDILPQIRRTSGYGVQTQIPKTFSNHILATDYC